MIGKASLRLGTIGSIEINVNVTWLAVFGLLIYWLRVGYVAESAPDIAGSAAWLISGAGALILFASVLAHELSHSLVAIRNGLPIKKITLFRPLSIKSCSYGHLARKMRCLFDLLSHPSFDIRCHEQWYL